MNNDTESPHPIGWLRAIVTGAGISLAAILVLVYGTNAVLTKWHGRNRHGLVALATTMFFVMLVVFAWALRQLQSRKVI